MADFKELIILRHGKSDWHTDDSDFYRPLNKRGIRNVKQMALWLQQQDLVSELIVSSPAVRALTTAEIIAHSMDLSNDKLKTDKSVYEASLSDLIKVLSQVPQTVQRLLLIGHNPGLEQLLINLAPEIPMPDDANYLPTATAAYLQLDSSWTSLQAGYLLQRPKDLPE